MAEHGDVTNRHLQSALGVCETRAKSDFFLDFFSFVLYSPTRAGAGSSIRDLQYDREVAFSYIRDVLASLLGNFAPQQGLSLGLFC